MVDDLDVLFRPVSRGYYRAENLFDGSIDLEFVMLCNHAIDVEIENTLRQQKRPPPGLKKGR